MKGFIEVKKIFADTKKKENVLVNINAIVSVGSYGEFMSIEFQNNELKTEREEVIKNLAKEI